ncbi:uncharacterized protein MONBRDRAFT_38555 [Monosiga brevicollis MX1]|uniref:Phosphatidylinositol 3,4,5-trisphosphate 3-phosphatase and dual-specificity protein phosphatase PTEN n=1 Tax=Monosiga brevicollis TaxID=81824 RepID=A9V8Q5_MONBE|nr:uncharacterized protein MONBRDRAFT_38555 [Monosiga brevicollis MX1]EDQ86125.1 predicted protein [Monosiga brevicollis MX1]|eukprot:XP_001749050.1 hypothetical protein [Monosiga brevicollis MX1]
MATIAKHLVSKKKRRFMDEGFDLDLTFITRNIVAMGFPAEGREGIYRNHMRDVKRFFDYRCKDHYRVYNLCSERDYDPQKFYGRVAKYPFDDHNAPPFLLMQPFCEDVHQYLSEDSRNVAVIHCKAGKGRTGVMISAYLMHCGLFEKTEEALEFYGHARTMNGKGVTIPSQVRYVHYYGRYVREQREFEPIPLIMKRIILHGIPDFKDGTCVPQFTLRHGPQHVLTFKSGWYEGISREQGTATLELKPHTPVCGDVKLEFIHRKGSSGKEKMFHLWFNTFFIVNNRFYAAQSEVDKANKDKKNKIYPEGFAIEILFDNPEGNAKTSSPLAANSLSASTASAQGMVPTASDGSDPAIPATSRGGQPMLPSRGPDASGEPLSAIPGKLTHRDSNVSQAPEFSDSDLTTTDEDDDEWEGLPISDV